MDTKPSKIPPPTTVDHADPEPAAVEFLHAELPQHVRAFLEEQTGTVKPPASK